MSSQLSDGIHRFDDRADTALEYLRGRSRALDAVFLGASALGDFSLIWHLVGGIRGLTSDHHANQAFLFSALIGAESLIVNQGVKRLFRRTRPTEAGDPRFPVRKPSTSSFPSGHASAAFFAASLLTAWSGWPTLPAWFALACVVAISRAFVRIHHASDIIGGAILGLGLAQVALLILRTR